MDTVALLGDRLRGELGFRALEQEELPESLLRHPGAFTFLGAKTYFGSLVSVGLVAADGLGPEDLGHRFGLFRAVFDQLLEIGPTARGLVVGNLTGRSALLAFVFEAPPTRDQIEGIREFKYGSVAKLGYCRAWAIDVINGKVHKHKGLPLKLYPSKRFFQEALQLSGSDDG